MEHCTIERVRDLEASILGRGADVRHSGTVGSRRLIVGDHSRAELD
jgi:hypothetical protein